MNPPLHRCAVFFGLFGLHGLLACLLLVGALPACSGKGNSSTSDMPPLASDPGRVTLHRLNRAEYDNTVRDLLGTKQTPAASTFPVDDRGYGFDNVADVLSLSPLQIELYSDAADALAAEALAVPPARPTVTHFDGAATPSLDGRAFPGMPGIANVGWLLTNAGDENATISVPYPGTFQLRAQVFEIKDGDDVLASLLVDGASAADFTVPALSAAPMVLTTSVKLSAGTHTIGVSYNNDDVSHHATRGLVVMWFEAEGPTDAPAANPERTRLLPCDPAAIGAAACAKQALSVFARRAFRRAVSDDEVAGLVALVTGVIAGGGSFDDGMRAAVSAVLTSPHFLFRVEIDPHPDDPTASHPLTGYEVASRLSYFLWSSTPDDALLDDAAAGKLDTADGVAAAAYRLLADDKAQALVENFAGQWLFTRGLADLAPARDVYPSWDADLAAAMRAETEGLFGDLLAGTATIDTLLTADYTYVNARLARHYGIAFDPTLGALQRVALSGIPRRGILGQGTILATTSNATRTSPVKRGKWVLEQLLCAAPPPPPPGVPPLPTTASSGTLRQLLEQHAKDPVCATCHLSMDPIGFALEHFDGIGAWRDTDSGQAIDATGQTGLLGAFDGESGPGSVSQAIVKSDRFHACVVQQLFTYALGRAPEIEDGDRMQQLTTAFSTTGGGRLHDLVGLLVRSDAFRMRRGESPASAGPAPDLAIADDAGVLLDGGGPGDGP